MNKLLVLAIYYAPYNDVGSFRSLKRTKYLARQGYKQYIFTCDHKQKINKELNSDIPRNAIVYRKPIKIFNNNSLTASNQKRNILHKVGFLLKDLFFSPDRYIWWVLSSIPKIVYIIKKEKIRIVYISGNPFSSFIGGYFLKKLCDIKLVLDFRDPWKDMPINKKQSLIRKSIDIFWERICVKNADLITVCSDNFLFSLKSNYHLNDKIINIPNGFDLDDFMKNESDPDDSKKHFIFLYTGKYSIKSDEYNPSNIIIAFNMFLERTKTQDCELHFVGMTDNQTKDYIRLNGNDCVKCHDLLPKHDVIKKQMNADALIHFYYPETHVDTISMKIYEYAVCHKPILSFNVKEGDLYNFLIENELGETVDSHNCEEIAHLFNKAYQKKILINKNKEIFISKYNVEYLTSLLSNSLKKLISEQEQ